MQPHDGELRRILNRARRRLVVTACRAYLGAGMAQNRFRTACVALAVVTTAAGAAIGAAVAVVVGAPVPDGATAGIIAVSSAASLSVLTMLVIVFALRRTGRSPTDAIDNRLRRRSPPPPNAVRRPGPAIQEPVVPLGAPAFFLLMSLLLAAEALWDRGSTTYWWAAISCLLAAALTAAWRTASRRAIED